MDKKRLLSLVSSEQLMEYTAEISKEVRLSGSAEEKRSFEYAEKVLKDMGYETNLYYRKALISLPLRSELIIGNEQFPSITHAMASSSPSEGLQAELIYIGDEQFTASSAIEGKAVLIDGLATPGAVQKAEEHGAIAAIFINAKYTHEMIVSSVWGNPSIEDTANYPSIPVASINHEDGQRAIEMTAKNTTLSIKLKTDVLTEWRDIPTLTADYICNPNSKDFLLFSGHIDSWHYGVMDNGSADATILECARILQKEKPSYQRNIRFAFWSGHSHGRYAGSALYADEHFEELYDHCLLHLNVDSVGGINSTVMTAGNTMAETKELIHDSVQLIANQAFEGTRFGRAGDQSFWGAGVPSALMGLSEQEPVDTPAMKAFAKLFGGSKGGGFGWWWHTTEDTLDKIDPQNLMRDCQIYLSIIHDFCSASILPIKQSAAITEIKQALQSYQEQYYFKDLLELTFNRLEQLEKAAKRIESLAANLDVSMIDSINQWNKQMSRGLVRINYVDQDMFSHDQALAQGPVPSIANLLKKEGLASLDDHIIYTSMKRRINKINFVLRGLLECSEKLETIK